MKELFLLLKNTFKNKRRSGQKGSITGMIRTPLAVLLPGTIFGATIGIVLYSFLSQIPPVPISSSFTIIDFITGIWILPISLLFILSYAPFISMSLFGSEETRFLQTLPVDKSSIYWNFSIQSFIMAGIPVFFLIPVPIVYGMVTGANFVNVIFTAIFFIFFLFSIANLIGILVSFIMSKTAAKFWGLVAYFLSIFFYIGIMYSPINRTDDIGNIYTMLQKTTALKSFVFSPFSFSSWFVKGLQGHFIHTVLLFITGSALIFITYKLAGYLDFSIERRSERGEREELKIRERGTKFPFIKKNFRILLRDPQSLYLIAFAVIFPLLFSYSSDASPLLLFGIVFPFYTGLVSSRILAQDMKNLPFPFQLPVSFRGILFSALIIPAIIFTLAYLIIISFTPGKTYLLYALTPLVALVLYICSAITLLFVLKNPDRDYTGRRVLDLSETIMVEFITIIISIFILGGGYFTLSLLLKGGGILKGAMASLNEIQNFNIIAVTAFIVSTIAGLIYSNKIRNKSEKLLERIKKG